MKKYLATLLLFGFIQTAYAIDTYDFDTGILSLDSVVVDGIKYNNVKVLLFSPNVLSIGSSEPYVPTPPPSPSAPPVDPISNTCTSNHLNAAKFNMIQLYMTLDQVISVVGCRNDPNGTVRSQDAITYVWSAPGRTLYVLFDTMSIFTKDIGGGIFKGAVGF